MTDQPKPRTFHVKSFGCQMNVYDGERMADALAAEGYAPAAAGEEGDADLVVLGARGDGGFPGMHIGRVALHLMGHSASPVILVR